VGELVVMGAEMTCSQGVSPASLVLVPNMVTAGGMTTGAVTDFAPEENIPTFGMCHSPANPRVAAATATPPVGVLKPQPCVPNTVSPWTPGSPTVTIGGIPALTSDSVCACAWAGTITISDPGQVTVSVG
jgi:hypothetical protein